MSLLLFFKLFISTSCIAMQDDASKKLSSYALTHATLIERQAVLLTLGKKTNSQFNILPKDIRLLITRDFLPRVDGQLTIADLPTTILESVIRQLLRNNGVVLELANLSLEKIEIAPLISLNEKISHITKLDLKQNLLTALSSKHFEWVPHLKSLVLNTNKISLLPKNSFVGLTALTELYLHENRLKTIREETFDSLLNLEILNLSNNNIKFLTPKLFHKLSKLKYLFLQVNNLTYLTKETFTGLIHLQFLSLQKNNIINIERGTFAPLVNLHRLVLPKNIDKRLIKQIRSELPESCILVTGN